MQQLNDFLQHPDTGPRAGNRICHTASKSMSGDFVVAFKIVSFFFAPGGEIVTLKGESPDIWDGSNREEREG